MKFYAFVPSQPIFDAKNLPLTLISLEDWALATITGLDSEKYLQGQVTVDVNQITEYQHILAAHCNPKGKVWSTLRIFRCCDGFNFIERRSVLNLQLTEMKKYAIFSKVNIANNDKYVLLGVAGFQARDVLKNLFSTLPDFNKQLINDNDSDTSLLWLEHPKERFILVTSISNAKRIKEILQVKAQLNNSQQWLSLNIEAGEPVIDAVNSGKFIPQAINLQALSGISFKKGCYIGQEIISRTKFRGNNKYILYYLSGQACRAPIPGESLEFKIGDKNWRRVGTVLAATKLIDDRLLVQAVINHSNINTSSVFRIHNEIKTLRVKPLPYSII